MLKETETEETIAFFVTFLSLVIFLLGGGGGAATQPPWVAYVASRNKTVSDSTRPGVDF